MEFDTDFDEVIDRANTNAAAKEGYQDYLFKGQDPVVFPCPVDDVISMWVADMAFASAPAARHAMIDRVQCHPIFGYTFLFDDELYDAFAAWCDLHYGWRPDRDHFLLSHGIVDALYDLVEFVLEPGEKVMTLTPAYGFFKHAPESHDRDLVTCALMKNSDGGYEIDFDAFEQCVADSSLKMFFLCHPHNPTGRTWSDDELRRMADLCFANDVLIVSDEIHCDLLRSNSAHTPLAKLYPESDQVITCMSASKTFNLAGMGCANVIIPNDELRQVWIDQKSPTVNPLSIAAVTGAFQNGHEWRTALLGYLDGNFRVMKDLLDSELPSARFAIPDATYLGWVDLSAHFEEGTNLTRHFAEEAGVLLEGGDMFVADAEGHVRINAACPRSVLEDGLHRVIAATPKAAS